MARRIAVIDIGSNTVRFVVYDGNSRSPLTFYNEKVTCRLGARLQQTGRLNPDGWDRALRALRRFKALCASMDVTKVVALATAAVRSASDGAAFCMEAEAQTGFKIRVISGPEEARLAAFGVISGRPRAKGLVCDMGGSSMELAWVEGGEAFDFISTPFAPLSVSAGAEAKVAEALSDLRGRYPKSIKTLFLVGGSFRAIARLDIERIGYPLTIVHEYHLSADGIRAVRQLLDDDDTRIAALDLGISNDRYELLPNACEVLSAVVDTFSPKRIMVSSFGLREGALYDAMPGKIRKRDPLLAAAEAAAKRSARFPDFGLALYDWLKPLFAEQSIKKHRLIESACLLHDVNWRAHPDYRAELSFDTAARANLAGLSHKDRVFLGLALMHRYAMRLSNPAYLAMRSLLSEDDNQIAEAVGKAMRLGALFSSAGAEGLDGVEISQKGSVLCLRLGSEAEGFDGEQVDRRLADLGHALQLDARLCH